MFEWFVLEGEFFTYFFFNGTCKLGRTIASFHGTKSSWTPNLQGLVKLFWDVPGTERILLSHHVKTVIYPHMYTISR